MPINESRRSFIKASTFLMGGGLLSLSLADHAITSNANLSTAKSGKCVSGWENTGKIESRYYRILTRKGEYLVNRSGIRLLESMSQEKTGMVKCICEFSKNHPEIPLESIILDCDQFTAAARAAAVL